MSDQALPAPPAAEHRGWSRKMILWSAAFAAFLLLAAWGVANWRKIHLAYCQYLLGSSDSTQRDRGTYLVLRTHVQPGMTREEVSKLLAPVKVVPSTGRTCMFALTDKGSVTGMTIVVLEFDGEGRLAGSSLWGHLSE